MDDSQGRDVSPSSASLVEDLPVSTGSLTLTKLPVPDRGVRRGHNTVKLTVNLPSVTVAALRGLAAERGVTQTEVVRQAIEGEHFLREEIQNGGRVLIEQADGSLVHLVFR